MSVLEIMNFLMVPAISVSIFYRRRGEAVAASARLVLTYFIFAVCNILPAHAGCLVAKWVLNRTVKTDSVFYTFIAISCALVLPYVAEIWRKGVTVELEITPREAKQKDARKK